MSRGPGRACPLHYRHAPDALARAPVIRADVAWVVGGLYGNVEALEAITAAVEAERLASGRVALVFNGDFHWFDVDRDDFRTVQRAIAAGAAISGNVELELARPEDDAGCGCAYPDFVDDQTVERSNRIMRRLQASVAGMADSVRALRSLPRLLRLVTGDVVTGVLHGDPESVAGWRFAYERVTDPEQPLTTEQVRDWASEGAVDAFACTHTCLPWAARFEETIVINNGSAGMPNFAGDRRVLVTRIAADGSSHTNALYGIERDGVRWEAVAVEYDSASWLERFRRHWPAGSPAHESYHARLVNGPRHELAAVIALAEGRPAG